MNLERVLEMVDRLTNMDLTARGVIEQLYTAARANSAKPLGLQAAERLHEVLRQDSRLLILTGFSVNPERIPETDGPVGAALLSRALDRAYGCKSAIVTADRFMEVTKATINASGMVAMARDDFLRGRHATGLIGFPIDLSEAKQAAKRLLDEFKPSAIIAIECCGRNERGIYHNMRGFDISPYTAKEDEITDEASKRGILTIGIGDGGNEIGMGKIVEAVRKHVPYGAECQCECNRGLATTSSTDILVTAVVSNWGANNIIASTAARLGKIDILHKGVLEERVITACALAGAIDGVTGSTDPAADGFAATLHASMTEIIGATIRAGDLGTFLK